MYMMTPVVQTLIILIHPHTKHPLQRFSEQFHSWSQQRSLNFFPKNFLYPGMVTMIVTVLISNSYLLAVFVWA